MHANKVPILIQWRGEGPDEAKSAVESRKLRKTAEPSVAQNFYDRMRDVGGQEPALDESPENQRKLQSSYKHVVTFEGCIFTVGPSSYLPPL